MRVGASSLHMEPLLVATLTRESHTRCRWWPAGMEGWLHDGCVGVLTSELGEEGEEGCHGTHAGCPSHRAELDQRSQETPQTNRGGGLAGEITHQQSLDHLICQLSHVT